MSMDKAQRQFLVDLQSLYNHLKKINRKCMYPDCKSDAIYSHVFSRKHILQPICPDSKIHLFEARELIFTREDDMLHYKLRGLKEAFGFNGFCNNHDCKLFAKIEPKQGFVDWSNIHAQYLLSYRSLCREAYFNRVIRDLLWFQLNHSISTNPNYHSDIKQLLFNFDTTYHNLGIYKYFLERGILEKDYSDIDFQYIELPYQLDLCISSPINVLDDNGPCFKYSFQETNLVNVFPYYGKTIIMIGFSKKFNNKWMNKIMPMFKSPHPNIVSAAFSDLLYRVEFNAIGPKLFEQLHPELVNTYYVSFQAEATNFSLQIENKISNLFYEPLNKIMPNTCQTL